MPFAVRIVNYQHSRMLNICDSNLVGKILKESELTLNINRSYFAERVVEENEAEDLLRKSSVINMVGKETIALSLKIGIGSSKGVKKIDGIPFLLVFKF
ncbi:MAG: DUF424 domain-containing protein [Thaumarchaeota archaeon]|nr:MAG: DUF424 domain-containing protein [Nitrososphaerota archaeon]TLX94809.1 MAG: DUF424 domain-containing protein [Nitrososphaerota archaeon]